MTELRLTTIDVPGAALGSCSPLPLLAPLPSIGEIDGAVPADIARRARSGTPPSLLPYLAQDDYGRRLEQRPLRVAVLENEHLRATVALDLGGRVLSLFDRDRERELLYVNPVLQPANFALRNAWFSGGVEWNIGTRGHSPTTMEPLHAAVIDGADGEPVLRLWEWERLRSVAFQVDLSLPPGAPLLLAHVRIRNPAMASTPMYWWTNAAIVARPGTRIIAPAVRAFRTEYPDRLTVATVPDGGDGVDATYPARHVHAADLFFDLDGARHPWIAAVDDDGAGIAHVSTAQLGGRKLFVWGTGAGGTRWQHWLSHGGDDMYAEIQGGLAATQFEHVTMPGRSMWSWTEAWGSISVDPGRSHGRDWHDAVACTAAAIDGIAAEEHLAGWHRTAGETADRPPSRMLGTGSGWGALERRRREANGEECFDDSATPYPDSALGREQAPWLALLDTGELPLLTVSEPPPSYVVGSDWEARLDAAAPSWLTDYHLAVMAHGRGDRRLAAELYRSSLRRAANAWAQRGLGVLAAAEGRPGPAAEHAVVAVRLAPGEWRLAAEAVARLLDDYRPTEAVALVNELPAAVRRRGRVRLLEAWAACGAGDVQRAGAMLEDGLEVADLREGERSLDALWRAVHPGVAVPPHYDFRMH
jgi:hypothetical protein